MFTFGSDDMRAKLDALDRSQAIIEFQPDGSILTANTNFLHVMGYTLDEVQGRHHGMFVDPAYRESAEYRGFWDNNIVSNGTQIHENKHTC